MRSRQNFAMQECKQLQALIILTFITLVAACGSSGPGSNDTAGKRDKVISEFKPQGLTAQSQENAIMLEWPAVSSAEAYHLYWSTDPVADIETSQRIANVASPYTHTDLSNDTNYYYRFCGCRVRTTIKCVESALNLKRKFLLLLDIGK